MSIFHLKAIPAALVAAGVMVSGGAYAIGYAGIPATISGIYAQGTFAPTSYMAVTRSMYALDPTLGATATGGFIAVLLKPTQTAWGYALSLAGASGDDFKGSATLTHTLTTGTTSCTAKYRTSYDSKGTITLSVYSLSAVPATGTTTCKTAFSNQTGLAASEFVTTGGPTEKAFNLIY